MNSWVSRRESSYSLGRLLVEGEGQVCLDGYATYVSSLRGLPKSSLRFGQLVGLAHCDGSDCAYWILESVEAMLSVRGVECCS